ncbi:hypothetical protein IKU74_05285 [bacterium]|nr:hypothetical protein [bacterium]
MTDSISLNQDMRRIVRYATHSADIEDPSLPYGYSDFALAVGTEKAIDGGRIIFSKENREAYKATREGLKGYTNYKRINDIENAYKRQLNAEIKNLKARNLSKAQLDAAIDCEKRKYINKVKQTLAQTEKLDAKAFAQKLDDIELETRRINLDTHNKKVATNANRQPTTRRGKLTQKAKTIINKGKSIGKEALVTSSKTRKIVTGVSKFAKSNALAAVAVDTLLVGGMEVYETKQKLGEEAAIRQAKREVKTAGIKVAGYAIGAKAGSLLGAKIGASIGTCVAPGIGTAIGTVIGVACGFAGAYLAGLAGEGLFGKSELEQATDRIAEEATENAELRTQIINQAVSVHNEEIKQNNGEDTDKTKAVRDSIFNIKAAYENDKPTQTSTTSTPETPVVVIETPTTQTKTNSPKEQTLSNDYSETIKQLESYANSMTSYYTNGLYTPTSTTALAIPAGIDNFNLSPSNGIGLNNSFNAFNPTNTFSSFNPFMMPTNMNTMNLTV